MRRSAVLIALVLLSPGPAAGALVGPARPAGADLLPRRMPLVPAQPALQVQPGFRETLVELDRGRGGLAAPLLAENGAVRISRRLEIWRLPTSAARRLLPRLARAGLLRAVEPDRPLERFSHLSAGDPLLPNQWCITAIGADRAEPPGPGKPVTIIDSGLDLTHPEFAGRLNTTALNEQRLEDPEGFFFHGTAVASLVGAPANGLGLVGVYPQAVLYAWDADASGGLTTSDVIAGIEAAIDHGPGVVNMSFGVSPSALLLDVVNAAFGSGSLLVAAPGNDRQSGSRKFFPAVLPHVLTVAATDMQSAVTFFSSASPTVDLAAPGEGIPVAVPTSYDPSGYQVFNGTSFSAPIVAGAAAWVWTARPQLDQTQLFELLRSSARDVPPAGHDRDTGFGVLDIPAALTRSPPASDLQEPNDDIDHVKAGGLFRRATAPLTGPGRPRRTIAARVDQTEDPGDVYRVWVPGRRTVTAMLSPNADVNVALWGPRTRTIFERGAALKRDLIDFSLRKGTRTDVVSVENTTRRGSWVFAEVFPAEGTRVGGYRLAIKTAKN